MEAPKRAVRLSIDVDGHTKADVEMRLEAVLQHVREALAHPSEQNVHGLSAGGSSGSLYSLEFDLDMTPAKFGERIVAWCKENE